MQRPILRSQSSRTASDKALTSVGPLDCGNKAEQRRRRAKGCKRPLPLSRDSIHSSKRTRRQRLGQEPPTSTACASVKNSASSTTRYGPLNLEEIISPPGRADRSCASLLLSQARRSIELDTDWLGRKRYIMDVILDLKAQVAENSAKPDTLLSPMHTDDQNYFPPIECITSPMKVNWLCIGLIRRLSGVACVFSITETLRFDSLTQ